jgi:hypothetical protein
MDGLMKPAVNTANHDHWGGIVMATQMVIACAVALATLSYLC